MDKKRIFIISFIVLIFIIALLISMLNYNGKYSVKFETGTSDIFLTKYVEKNGKINEPIEPNKEGYIFKEWQLNGKKYDFDSDIESDIVLTAKWVKEEYVTIEFDTLSDEKIESKKILKGERLEDLPVLDLEDYNFIGWTLNDKLYDNEEFYDDAVLVAKLEKKEVKVDYKVGDTIIITGSYSESSTSEYAYHNVAIDWEREILYIIDGANFPYAVGNENGVTGFFKESSIELKKAID